MVRRERSGLLLSLFFIHISQAMLAIIHSLTAAATRSLVRTEVTEPSGPSKLATARDSQGRDSDAYYDVMMSSRSTRHGNRRFLFSACNVQTDPSA